MQVDADKGEDCDDGQNGNNDDGCTDKCKFPSNADGFTQASLGEKCDDGNKVANDGCETDFKISYGYKCQNNVYPSSCSIYCGDGIILSPHENCDDNNESSGDGCSSSCLVENSFCGGTEKATQCGNGTKDPGEQCDHEDLLSSTGVLGYDQNCVLKNNYRWDPVLKELTLCGNGKKIQVNIVI